MATVAVPCQPSQFLPSPSAASRFEASENRQLQQKQPAARGHYRPFSTLCVVEDKEPVSHQGRVLVKPRPQSVQRSTSLGAIQAMGLGLKKAGGSNKGKEMFRTIRIGNVLGGMPPLDPTPEHPPTPPSPSSSSSSSSTRRMSRSSTANAEGGAERSGNSKGGLHRVRAQRSIASLFSAASDVSPNSAVSDISRIISGAPSSVSSSSSSFRTPKCDAVDKAASIRSGRSARTDIEEPVNSDTDVGMDNTVMVTRSKTKVHPYFGEAPYMQAYDRPCLDNDRYSDLLLRRLNPISPSFFNYGKKPPLTVLDLGCGQGHWILWAASTWKNCRITGLDIVDICLPAVHAKENVSFVRGNLLFKLPFPAKSFEYIRMANLSLCIPYNKWLSLLDEVRRILTNGGRLEIIDDQMYFPYGEEPLPEEPLPEPLQHEVPTVVPGDANSFFDFHDSESDSDTFEESGSTASSSSTLVSERDSSQAFDKIPDFKRNSGQSDKPVSIVSVNSSTPSSRDKPLPVPSEADTTSVVISPSPTITQASVNRLDEENPLTASDTFTQASALTGTTRRRKSGSVSSTRSKAEAISTWKEKRHLSQDMETIFEYILVNKYCVHPRPAEFVQDSMRKVFGKGNAGKIRSFHLKLAPFDSPIGPGGMMSALTPPLPSPKAEIESYFHPNQVKQRSLSQSKDKEKKDKKLDMKIARDDIPRLQDNFDAPLEKAPVITPKAASRLGVEPNVQVASSKRGSSDYSIGDGSSSSSGDGDSDSRQTKTLRRSKALPPLITNKPMEQPGTTTDQGPPPPVPPKPKSIHRQSSSEDIRPSTVRNCSAPPVPVKAARRLGVDPSTPIVRSFSVGSTPAPCPSSPPRSTEPGQTKPRSSTSTSALRTNSSGSSPSNYEPSLGSSDSKYASSPPSSDNGEIAGSPPVLSAKAAGRLGISYSVLAATAAVHTRESGSMAPVQSPGLLVWPSTYLAVSPTELEMHACKSVQTLLSCRHAMREYITGDFQGEKLANEEDFEDAIWEYECFRRGRFHWPNENKELFEEQGFPEPPSPAIGQRSLNQASGNQNVDSFNGQYRRDELTHVRTIRVFEAVKSLDEKSLASMLLPGSKSL